MFGAQRGCWSSTIAHVLTHFPQLFFVILFAFFILNEQPTILALICAAGATGGAILVSLEFEKVS